MGAEGAPKGGQSGPKGNEKEGKRKPRGAQERHNGVKKRIRSESGNVQKPWEGCSKIHFWRPGAEPGRQKNKESNHRGKKKKDREAKEDPRRIEIVYKSDKGVLQRTKPDIEDRNFGPRGSPWGGRGGILPPPGKRKRGNLDPTADFLPRPGPGARRILPMVYK